MNKAAPSHRFKYNRFTRKDAALNTPLESKKEQRSKLDSEVAANIDAKEGSDNKDRHSIEKQEQNEKSKAAPSHRFKYNRFTRKGDALNTPLESKKEQLSKLDSEVDATDNVPDRCDDKDGSSIEKQEQNEMNKAAPLHRFKYNRFTTKEAALNRPVESKKEQASKLDSEVDATDNVRDRCEDKDRSSIEVQEPNTINESARSHQVEYNRFARKKAPSVVRHELDRRELPNSKDVDTENTQDDTAQSSNESQKSEKRNETLVETQKAHINNDAEVPEVNSKRMVRSMSIRERRMFFESQNRNSKSS